MKSLHWDLVVSVIAGMGLGFLILHPYSMLVQRYISPGPPESMWRDLGEKAFDSFGPVMLSMGLAFALFGGVIGLLVAVLSDRRKKLLISRHEKEKQQIALRTIHDLMVTLSHHLLNANMIIGGKVRHCRKSAVDQDLLECLNVIEEQGRKIDAVLKSLRNLVEIHTVGYTTDRLVTMLDISKDLEEQLGRSDLHAP